MPEWISPVGQSRISGNRMEIPANIMAVKSSMKITIRTMLTVSTEMPVSTMAVNNMETLICTMTSMEGKVRMPQRIRMLEKDSMI